MEKRLALIVISLLLLCAVASAKSYSLEKAEVYYKIMPDGLVEATEKITFDFSGDFSFAYRDFPKGNWQVVSPVVYDITNGKKEALRAELSDLGSDMRVKWFYSASNETRAFAIEYELHNAVDAYDDIAEFNWKVWGSGWEEPLGELYGEIELPAAVGSPEEVYSWGHPEINGKIGLVGNRTLIFQAFGIPAGQWVEIRMLFPRQLLQSEEFANVKSGNGLEGIVAEEEAWGKADEARALLSSPLFILLFALLELAVFAMSWHFWGKEPKVELQAIYEREVPYNYSPAIVSSLMHPIGKNPSLECITAEILDLCLKGKLQIRPLKKEKILGIFGKDDFEIQIY